jgi:hypothetical protein
MSTTQPFVNAGEPPSSAQLARVMQRQQLHRLSWVVASISLTCLVAYGACAANRNEDCSSRLAIAYMRLMNMSRQGIPDPKVVEQNRHLLLIASHDCPVPDGGLKVPMMGTWTRGTFAIAANDLSWVSHNANAIRDEARAAGEARLYPLHVAAGFATRPMVELLISRGFDVNQREPGGETPLMVSAYLDLQTDSENSEALIKAGADVNAISDNGSTALFFAVAQEDAPLVATLLHAGALVRAGGKSDYSVITLTRKHGNAKIVALIEKADSPSPK